MKYFKAQEQIGDAPGAFFLFDKHNLQMAKDKKDNKENIRQDWGEKFPVLPQLDLLTVQKESYKWFEDVGIGEVLQEISPIDDFTGKNWSLILKDYRIGDNSNTPEIALNK